MFQVEIVLQKNGLLSETGQPSNIRYHKTQSSNRPPNKVILRFNVVHNSALAFVQMVFPSLARMLLFTYLLMEPQPRVTVSRLVNIIRSPQNKGPCSCTRNARLEAKIRAIGTEKKGRCVVKKANCRTVYPFSIV